MELWESVQPILINVLISVLTAAVAWLGTKASKWISASVHNQHLESLALIVSSTVAEVMQTSVITLKAAAEDGRLTAEEARAAFDQALSKVRELLPKRLWTYLVTLLGGVAEAESFIGTLIEAAVLNLKDQIELDISKKRAHGVAPADAEVARARLGVIAP